MRNVQFKYMSVIYLILQFHPFSCVCRGGLNSCTSLLVFSNSSCELRLCTAGLKKAVACQ